ncbi:MAG: flavin reductase family protein [Candidatus Omnitrophica bacterium]|nr:flavin reductase family protein [Candidatus Omnitrophota bacterium]
MKKSLGARTLVYPTPVLIVGSYNKDGKPNAMAVSWGGVSCSDPPCVVISLRKATYTFGNIVSRHAFTVSIPSENYAKEADYFGLASGKSENKFSRTRLTPVKGEFVDAPYVQEFPLILECKVIKTVEIGLHTQFIGEILDVKADESVLGEDGLPDIKKVRPFILVPECWTYYGIGDCIGDAFSIGKEI